MEDLTDQIREEMLAVFEGQYDCVNRRQFWNDLSEKTHVILVRDQDNRVRGFSTAVVWHHIHNDQPIRILFSGDTAVDSNAQGHMALPITWMRFAGTIRSEAPETKLYWLLTTKGYRTYRFMPLFFRDFWPHWERACQQSEYERLGDAIGQRFFKENYHSDSGLIVYGGSNYTVKSEPYAIPAKDLKRPDVRYFLKRNGNYEFGDELLCLGLLDQRNIRTGLRRYFTAGLQRDLP
ncbi:hypothetical protein [Hoeflea poritis]|uniref:N-acetyltransferase domain-containing protein n=1 Tax=Hoeflea poritis TaxID=2993659 RepID=A0ABT4VR48_9HYPH|nr:hypothetical protein [Hoeflea poritis]MDA4847190.1 hypothetical protein [Hoeflea poritis]